MKLAIKGHPTRGKEVIEILEMLGGINELDLKGIEADSHYYVGGSINRIYRGLSIYPYDYTIYTLEEFLEKFPYKVGDKVWLHYENLTIRTTETIISMRWCSKYDCVLYDVCTCCNLKEYAFTPYKEETMEENKKQKGYCTEKSENSGKNQKIAWFTFWDNDFADEVELYLKDRELVQKDGKWFVVKKKKEYPKTYVECAKILESFITTYVDGYKVELLEKFQKLLICRDAYWKIAGEQMGLGKPWKPDWNDCAQHRFGLYTLENEIRCINLQMLRNIILVFPTKEMRDAFYENFKDLIEQCKELL